MQKIISNNNNNPSNQSHHIIHKGFPKVNENVESETQSLCSSTKNQLLGDAVKSRNKTISQLQINPEAATGDSELRVFGLCSLVFYLSS